MHGLQLRHTCWGRGSAAPLGGHGAPAGAAAPWPARCCTDTGHTPELQKGRLESLEWRESARPLRKEPAPSRPRVVLSFRADAPLRGLDGGRARAIHPILEIRGRLRQCPAPDRGWREPGPKVSSCGFKVSASAAFTACQKVRVAAPPERVTFFSQESVYKLVMQNKNVFFYRKILYPAVEFPDKSTDGYVTTQK